MSRLRRKSRLKNGLSTPVPQRIGRALFPGSSVKNLASTCMSEPMANSCACLGRTFTTSRPEIQATTFRLR